MSYGVMQDGGLLWTLASSPSILWEGKTVFPISQYWMYKGGMMTVKFPSALLGIKGSEGA